MIIFLILYRKYVNPGSIQSQAAIGPPAKRHFDGVSQVGRFLSTLKCLLGCYCERVLLKAYGPRRKKTCLKARLKAVSSATETS